MQHPIEQKPEPLSASSETTTETEGLTYPHCELLGTGSEMASRISSFDWSQTPVGAIATWSPSFKSLIKTMLASRYPMVLTWGREFTQFYNDAYSQLIGDKHPAALGLDIRITLAEAWDTLGPMIQTVMATGSANWTPALLLLLERSGYREESYFSVSHAPAEDDAGQIVGMLAVCSEVTQQVLGERRLRLLRDLSSKAGETRSVEATCHDVVAAIGLHPLDVPFALLYLREPDGTLTLRASVGLDVNDVIPRSITLASSDEIWSLARAAAGETVVVETLDRFITVLGGPGDEAVHSALVMPIAASTQTASLGVLVAGVSPNRALDEGYRSFYELLVSQVSVSIRNAQVYEEERRRGEALAELDRAKTMFFNNVSHEFRTPLTLMLAPAEDALADVEHPLSPPQRRRIEVLHRNSLRLLKLVNTLLDFSRIEAGRTQATFEPTDLPTLTVELASVFRSAIEQAGLRLTVDCPPLPEAVYVDRDLWEKIVLNLLSNAFKFTFEGEIAVALRWVGSSDGDGQGPNRVELEVRDTGTGIPAEELPCLFERFHRVQGARGRTFEGSGIGLSLVQELVHLHGGAISAKRNSEGTAVRSVVNQGTSFTVSIPTGCAHLPSAALQTGTDSIRADGSAPLTRALPYLEEALRWLPQNPVENTNENTKLAPRTHEQPTSLDRTDNGTERSQSRILIVDDNADMRDYLKRLLQPHYDVDIAADGEAAIALIASSNNATSRLPDLVLSDVMMPKLDGLQLLQALRADPATREVPIILLSARAGEESRLEGLETGADDYLIKPFSARELLARVRASLEMSRLRKQAELERAERIREQAARVEAETANRMKDEFLQVLSHEIRTPLNGMLGWAQMLKQGKLDASTSLRALDAIERSAKTQAQLVDDLLDVSRIIRGQLRLDLQPVSLPSIITAAIDAVRPSADAKSIQIQTLLDPDASLVSGDANRLQQVVWNLLSNAIKFTPPSGRIEVWLELVGEWVQIQVKDTGIGIRADFLPHVFERFRQADSSTTRSQGGLGLGLTIVRHLVELHGGTVRVDSEGTGQGATFSVRLPGLQVQPSSPNQQPSISTQPIGSLSGLRVITVDDDADSLALITFILEQAGAEVTAVTSAVEALNALRQVKPDLLVSDLGMPDQDGFSLIRQIRALPAERGGRIPAIALTAYAKEEDRRQALLSGFQTHIPKPVSPEELVVVVANLAAKP
ncbi:MAG: response regulator [Myxacorys californica WJT36-NPBG1]|jgi:signal transduction histidine kinase|nr:response regulator [Myxacorys californica WJT36-NPBG1]